MKISSNSMEKSDGYIQIRSAARWGQSDLGVNQRRVNFLINELNEINIDEKF